MDEEHVVDFLHMVVLESVVEATRRMRFSRTWGASVHLLHRAMVSS
jgi:hypothetical protein